MKKKLFIGLAIVLIAVTLCVCLVGCTPSNPGDFMVKWIKADKKMFDDGFGGKYMLNENVACIKTDSLEKYYEVIDNKINIYYGYKVDSSKKEWRVRSYTKDDYKKEYGIEFDLINEFNDECDLNYGVLLACVDDICKKAFVKKDGWYVTILPDLFGNIALKVSGQELLVGDASNLQQKDKQEKYKFGCDKIVIPQSAKDALKDANLD